MYATQLRCVSCAKTYELRDRYSCETCGGILEVEYDYERLSREQSVEEILPDKGLDTQLQENDTQSVIATMTPFLKRKAIKQAFEAGLERLSSILGTTGPGTGENELPDAIIEEKGV